MRVDRDTLVEEAARYALGDEPEVGPEPDAPSPVRKLPSTAKPVTPPGPPPVKPATPPPPGQALNQRLQSALLHPDPHGQFAEHVTAGIEAHPTLSPEQKMQHREGLTQVVGRMPHAALVRLAKHLHDVVFHPSSRELTEHAAKLGASRLLNVHGLYSPKHGAIYVDGDDDAPGSTSLPKPGIHAHELTHAIDGPRFEYSSSLAWYRCYDEIVRTKALSKYAMSHPREAFAEFGRLLFGERGVPREAIEKLLPLSSAFWKKMGLWK